MTLADAHQGDVVQINGKVYRVMIPNRNAWGCRERLKDGTWSDYHIWFDDCQVIEKIVLEQQRRNPKARKAKGSTSNDPLW